MRNTAVRTALVAVVGVVALLLVLPVAGAVAKTLYVEAGSKDHACSESEPCDINEGVEKANTSDSVLLAPGQYEELKLTGLKIENGIDIGGLPGEAAELITEHSAGVQVLSKAKATIHDVRIAGPGGLRLGSGTADRVYVAHSGSTVGCELAKGTTMRDSVCWSGNSGDALEVVDGGAENQDEPVVLRNVTAIANSGAGIKLFGGPGAKLHVNGANLIARSFAGPDISVEADPAPGTEAILSVSNSDFDDVLAVPPNSSTAEVTPTGTAGNISAVPTFVDPGNGGFQVSDASPTIDGGIADGVTGSIDITGHERSQPGCFGHPPVPDMGAYERTPTANCPAKPPPPEPPAEVRKPVFRILSIRLNKINGQGRLLVEVPGAGTLSLTGSGVKLVRRTAPDGGGVISVPIQAWAITRVRLSKLGKTRVHLQVIFQPRSGGVQEWGRSVFLRKKIRESKRGAGHNRP